MSDDFNMVFVCVYFGKGVLANKFKTAWQHFKCRVTLVLGSIVMVTCEAAGCMWVKDRRGSGSIRIGCKQKPKTMGQGGRWRRRGQCEQAIVSQLPEEASLWS